MVLVNIPGISLSLSLSPSLFLPSLPQLRTTRVRSTGETVKTQWSQIPSSPNTYPPSTTPQRSTPLHLPPTEGRPSCLASSRSTLPMAVALRGSRQDQDRLFQLSKLCFSRDFSLFFPPCLSVCVCVCVFFVIVCSKSYVAFVIIFGYGLAHSCLLFSPTKIFAHAQVFRGLCRSAYISASTTRVLGVGGHLFLPREVELHRSRVVG